MNKPIAPSSVEAISGSEPSSAFANVMIRLVRCARIEAEIAINQFDSVSVALAAGWMSGEDALACLNETGLLDWVTGVSS